MIEMEEDNRGIGEFQNEIRCLYELWKETYSATMIGLEMSSVEHLMKMEFHDRFSHLQLQSCLFQC